MQPKPVESKPSEGLSLDGSLDIRLPVLELQKEVWEQVGRVDRPEEYLARVLPRLAGSVGSDYCALAGVEEGQWQVIGAVGLHRRLPEELLGSALDQEASQTDGREWIVVPLAPREPPGAALIAHFPQGQVPTEAQNLLVSLGMAVYEAWKRVGAFHQTCRRVSRLETLLQIASRWNQTQELESLLVEIAEAAARLMECDRASIFLWDRATHTLVGRPALGVPGGELRIPDDRGVVGYVLQTGHPGRADAQTNPEWIDRQVDDTTGYRTRSVLAVPLRGRTGEMFGVFELLNKRQGRFTAEEEVELMELAAQAAVALENARDRQQLVSSHRRLVEAAAEGVELLGRSPAIEAIRSSILRVADTELPVLILGENGTGKEVVARAIHFHSRRRDKPFVPVNCAAIPDTLAESELFGHEKGAFTDARERRSGKFELASEGTLFLDEIGDLSLNIQAKLLRVLEEKMIVRVGGTHPIPTAARVIAATNQQLGELVRSRQFREDLFYRLNVVSLELPPLRDRPGDIMLLAEHFLKEFCRQARRPVPRFSPEARARLETHGWSGNVRELRNLMERLAYLGPEDVIESSDLAFILSPRGRDTMAVEANRPLAEATAQFQSAYIRRAIERAEGNMTLAAEQLGLHRSNLYRKMRQLGLLANPEQDS